MRKIIIALSFIYLLSAGAVCGAGESENEVDIIVPPGMKTIKEGDVNLVVYKDARMRKQGDVIMTETTDEYASRKFLDADNRFKKMEKEIEVQKNEIEDLKGVVKKLEEDGRKK